MKPIQAVLDQMEISDKILDVPPKELSKSLASIMKSASVSKNEKKANDVIKTECKTLKEIYEKGKIADYMIGKDLEWALENAPIERQIRINAILTEAEKFLGQIHQVPAAENAMGDIKGVLEKESKQREEVENTARYLLKLVVLAREERDQAMKKSLSFANNERGAFGIDPIPSDQSFSKSMDQAQNSEMFDFGNLDYYEKVPMTPYRQEMAEEEMRTDTEYRDFVSRGDSTAYQHLRANQKKYNGNKYMKEYAPRVDKYSKMSASNYDSRLIELISKNQDNQKAMNSLVSLKTLGLYDVTVIQPFIDLIQSKMDNDFLTFSTTCGIIKQNYKVNGIKYKDIYRDLEAALS
jgi:hypothetical protein